MRGHSSVAQPVVSTFSLVNDTLTSVDVMALEDYSDNVELFKRIRMYCNTLSFVSISKPDWPPFMTGELFADQALEWMNAKYNGNRLPLRFFVQAYISTFSGFIEAIRTNDTSLASLVANTSLYRSYWINFAPPVPGAKHAAASGASSRESIRQCQAPGQQRDYGA